MRVFAHWVVRLLPAIDTLLLVLLLVAALRGWAFPSEFGFLVTLLVVPFSQYLLGYLGLYDSHRMDTIRHVIRQILTAQAGAFCVFAAAAGLLGFRAEFQKLT